ncbi:hypothetical protein GJ496_006316 [Pomphorhynchus laevis]|nr:hypothetical protein GJ496_006316 [Pomphorhynchus laevis]
MTRSVETSNATKLSDNPGSFENILEDNITDTLLLEIYPHQEHIDASKTILDSSFTEVVNTLNNLYNDISHPRLWRLIGNFLAESAVAEPDNLKILLDKFVSIYTNYLTVVEKRRKPRNLNRLRDLSMTAVNLQGGTLTTLPTINYCVHKNPRKHKHVAMRIVVELGNSMINGGK